MSAPSDHETPVSFNVGPIEVDASGGSVFVTTRTRMVLSPSESRLLASKLRAAAHALDPANERGDERAVLADKLDAITRHLVVGPLDQETIETAREALETIARDLRVLRVKP